jgi:hypothetical protein
MVSNLNKTNQDDQIEIIRKTLSNQTLFGKDEN